MRFRAPESKLVAMTYDGRGFLSRAEDAGGGCFAQQTLATYSSEGVLHRREHRLLDGAGSIPQQSDTLLYFGRRPLAVFKEDGAEASLTYFSTDHLGSPSLATGEAGSLIWLAGLAPFGGDYSGANSEGIFLRLPGQWDDGAWSASQLGSGLFYNVHRWYHADTGRYTTADPLTNAWLDHLFTQPSGEDRERSSSFSYVYGNPLNFVDPLGLLKFKGCSMDQEQNISKAFKEYCAETTTPEFNACLCKKPSIVGGLKRLCKDPSLTVRCQSKKDENCLADCAWSRQFGRTINVCPEAWKPASCGPMGCTLLHEMTHILGYGKEKWPDEVEKCAGCS
jgi:RHS repeat-associated protein